MITRCDIALANVQYIYCICMEILYICCTRAGSSVSNPGLSTVTSHTKCMGPHSGSPYLCLHFLHRHLDALPVRHAVCIPGVALQGGVSAYHISPCKKYTLCILPHRRYMKAVRGRQESAILVGGLPHNLCYLSQVPCTPYHLPNRTGVTPDREGPVCV